MFDSEFNAVVAEASTSDDAFIVAELSKKLAHASRILMQKAKADADLRVTSATERLGLADKLRRAEAEVLALKDENQQLKVKCSKLESTASDNEKVLESLRRTIEGDANEKAALKGRITELRGFTLKWVNSSRSSPRSPHEPMECTKSTRRLLPLLARSLYPCLSRLKVPRSSFSSWIG